MNLTLLNKSDLSILNKRSLKYRLADAEKDYLLSVVAKIIYESPLRDKLVFKGGTAIHHCYLPQTRFSEDLDFTSLDKAVTLEDIKAVLEACDFLEVKEDYVSKATIKIERLKYSGPLALPGSLKVEIDFVQNVVLPAKTMIYKNAWQVDASVKVMDIKEICAEKIRATSDRARFRDFYDLVLLFDKFKPAVEEIAGLIKKKEIRNSIAADLISDNWTRVKTEREAELSRVYYAKEINDSMVKTIINAFKPFLPIGRQDTGETS